jgi:hypothetical protein
VYPPPAAAGKPKTEVVANLGMEMKGRFKTIEAEKPRDGATMAYLRFQVLPVTGGPMPGWFTREYTVKCHGQRYLSGGKQEPFDAIVFKKSPAKAPTKSDFVRLHEGTERIDVYFVVYRVDGEGFEGHAKEHAVARSDTYALNDIQPAKEYLIQFALLKGDLEKMNPSSRSTSEKPKGEPKPDKPKAGPPPEPEEPDVP